MKLKHIVIAVAFGITAFSFTAKPNLSNTAFVETVKDSTEPVIDKVYEFVEVMPEFPGGKDSMLAFISQNFKYPNEAIENKIEGRVLISFVVNEHGKTSYIKPLLPPARQLGYGLEEEAVRVVSLMPDWIPGTQGGKPVNVRYTLPIMCSLKYPQSPCLAYLP